MAQFDSQGHRGARGLAPENTLPAFARALTIGVHTLELDTNLTKDGVVVVIHDSRLNPPLARDRSGSWLVEEGPAVRSLTLARLKAYDVGRPSADSRYAKRFPEQISVDGTSVPTLEEVIDLVRRAGNRKIRFNIETKLKPNEPNLAPSPERFVEAILEVVKKTGISNRVTIQSFDWRTLKEVQRLAPGMPTSYLTARQKWLDTVHAGKPGPSPWMAGLDVDDFGGSLPRAIKAAGGAIWSPYHRDVTSEQISEAHGLGLKVWAVNDPARMRTPMDMGVDGIITDYPDRLRRVMEERRLDLPAPTPITP